MNTQLLLIAKAPVPGQVKTRLCPPCTPEQAAAIAHVCLTDTIGVLSRSPAARRTLVLHGSGPQPPRGWRTIPQRGTGLGERLANAFADTAERDTATVLVGMDTPQLSTRLLRLATTALGQSDAVLGPSVDGGWWLLGLRDPAHAAGLSEVPMSTPGTAAATVADLRSRGLRISLLPALRDIDTATDARIVAALAPHRPFAAVVDRYLPSPIEPDRHSAMAVYSAALRRAGAGRPARLDLVDSAGSGLRQIDAAWYLTLRPGDEGVVRRCAGATLDIGCGPGRLTSAVSTTGQPATGVDICAEAVRITRNRGARASLGSVFDPLPDGGPWQHALLIDGNIGIGGDPVRLLRRCRELTSHGGDVLVETDPPGHGSWRGQLALRDGSHQTTPFAWAFVDADDLFRLARQAALNVAETWTEADRWFARLTHA